MVVFFWSALGVDGGEGGFDRVRGGGMFVVLVLVGLMCVFLGFVVCFG